MPIAIDTSKVCGSIAAMLRADYKHDGNAHVFRVRGSEEVYGSLTDSWFEDIASKLSGNMQAYGDTGLSSTHLHESLVSEESRFGPTRISREANNLSLNDEENGYTYQLGPPSDEFLAFFLNRLADLAPRAAIRSAAFAHRIRRAMEENLGNRDVMSLVRRAYPRLLTCRVESRQARTPSELASHANSFLFSLTYNMNAALVEMRSLDEFIKSGRLASMSRSRSAELEPPKRIYIRDLTYHYQLGVSAESPVLEYLSFYHICEHFFESVFHDDLIEAIRERITRPDFSSKRKKDVQSLLKEINKRQRVRDDSIAFNEQEALRLTLSKHVSIENLREKLLEYDSDLIDYYRTTAVSFSAGDAVDIGSSDKTDVLSRLSKRIYKTRNSIVHSNDGEKSRFVPFQHDDALAKEIPLIRFIAEEIIISSSTLL
jgi:hypothetical protein